MSSDPGFDVAELRRRVATFWDRLKREMTPENAEALIEDEKIADAVRADDDAGPATVDARPRLYAPAGEVAGLRAALRGAAVDVEALPAAGPAGCEPADVHALAARPGLLMLAPRADGGVLPAPYLVPGGRFNEMYGWDSYFTALGLIQERKGVLASAMLRHQVYQIMHYGKVLNANRTYYLGRSQPPFITDWGIELYTRTHSRVLLIGAITAAIREYHNVWMSPERLDPETGLSRYSPRLVRGIPPETHAGAFDGVLRPLAAERGLSVPEFIRQYNAGTLDEPRLDEFLWHDQGVRESGHDTSARLVGVCAHLATVDLNALLYKYEHNISWALGEIAKKKAYTYPGYTERADITPTPEVLAFWEAVNRSRPPYTEPDGSRAEELAAWEAIADESALAGEDPLVWKDRAVKRREAVHKYMWDEERGTFYDYNTVTRTPHRVESATAFWTLWAGLASEEQAQRLVTDALPRLEAPGGLASTAKGLAQPPMGNASMQWDWPAGWAPHQIMAWIGLDLYGFKKDARRLARNWVTMIGRLYFREGGAIKEKYNVADPANGADVDAEYGNQGSVDAGFGWTNASVAIAIDGVKGRLRPVFEEE